MNRRRHARWHIGAMAQDVQAAFTAEGLDGFDYGVLCYDEWSTETEDGRILVEAGNRYGLRYDQLLAFVVAAM